MEHVAASCLGRGSSQSSYYSRTLSRVWLAWQCSGLVPWKLNGQMQLFPLDRFLQSACWAPRIV